MCGIVGLVDHKGVDDKLLLQMRESMIHRGPDDSGLWVNRDGTVGLAHRRLSIIDLSEAGRQPMSDSHGQVWITFNGEIYNFQEIREELREKGYQFKSQTDTEVILKSYEEWGTDCLDQFNGMFAFGIYDESKKILFLARDRVGKKPLYYAWFDGKFLFASELKALLRDKAFPREIDLQALNHYLTFGYIGGDLSIYKVAKKLLPSHAMTYDVRNGERKVWRYWEPSPPFGKVRSEEELIEELEAILTDAVRLRMISDVNLGAFMSGGLDSSLIVAMMSRVSKDPVKTFTIGFQESQYNELPFARIVANHFGTDHHEIMVKPEAFSILPELVRQFDEPFADSSMIPTYYVAKATKEFVTVALSGDGGDELFGGYPSYRGTLLNSHVARWVPSFIRKGAAGMGEYLPERMKGRRHLLRFRYDPYDAFVDRHTHGYFNQHQRRLLLHKDVQASLNSSFTRPETLRGECLLQNPYDLVNRLTYTDFRTYLPDDILVKVDRMSMMVSLEVRAPFLDHRIMDFSFHRIPGHLKVKGMTLKYLLKKLAKKILPRELNLNRKWGFSIPVSEWFRGTLSLELKKKLLEDGSLFFQRDYVERLLGEHQSGIDHSGRLFTLLIFSLWEKESLVESAIEKVIEN
jgi:asparagine synthase (glutamine-hydrolysing)